MVWWYTRLRGPTHGLPYSTICLLIFGVLFLEDGMYQIRYLSILYMRMMPRPSLMIQVDPSVRFLRQAMPRLRGMRYMCVLEFIMKLVLWIQQRPYIGTSWWERW